MGYDISLANYLSLPLLGLIVYWYGLFFTNYFPFKCKKEEIYRYGVLFLVVNIAAPLLVSMIIIAGVSLITSESRIFLIVIASVLLYAISGLFIVALSSKISTAQKKELTRFLDKEVAVLSLKLLNTSCWLYIISTSVMIYNIFYKIAYTLEILNITASMSLILSTLVVMSIASSLFGYKETSFPKSIIKLKDNYIPIEGRIINYDDYVTYFDGQKKVKIKEDYIISIIDKK